MAEILAGPTNQVLTLQQEDYSRLTDIQLTALDLYARGLNVMPLKWHDKKGFKVRPFFTSRLHHCTSLCHHKGRDDIAELFEHTNIGVMTGKTSGNLVDIDCDSAESFVRMGEMLKGIPYWALASHRGGAYLVRVIEGEIANQKESKFKDVEIHGNRLLRVLPPSIHSEGTVYQWVTRDPRTLAPGETLPAVSIERLDFLGLQLAKQERKKWENPDLFGLLECFAVLSYPNRKTYAAKLSEGERNRRIFALACDMKAHENEIQYSEAERVVLDIADRCDLDSYEAIGILKSAYSQPRGPARKSGYKGLAAWQKAEMNARTYPWREVFGRRALKCEAVYKACIERAKLENRETWRATIRELGELANADKDTALLRLQDLAAAGLIKRANPTETKRRESGARYTFLWPQADRPVVRTVVPPGSNSVRSMGQPKTPAEQDLFARLGLTAWYVWKHLLDTPSRNAGQLAKAINMPRSSVYRALQTLEATNIRLATHSPAEGLHYGEPCTDYGLEQKALSLNAGGSPSRARKEQHHLERERHVNAIIREAIAYDRRAK